MPTLDKRNGKALADIVKFTGKNKTDVAKVDNTTVTAGPAHSPLWVCIGRDGRVLHSTDATTWSVEYVVPVGTSVDYWDLAFGKNGSDEDMWVISTGVADPELYIAADPTNDADDWSAVNFAATHKTRATEYGANGTWISTRNKNPSGTVQRSTNGGSTWTEISTGLTGVGVNLCIATDGAGLWIIGGASKTIKSYDDGLTWYVTHADRGNRIEYNNGVWLKTNNGSNPHYATSISSSSSTDTWNSITISNQSTWAVCHVAGNNWLLSRASDVWKSTDNCATWSKVTRPSGVGFVTGLATDGTTVAACGKDTGISYTTNLGTSWTSAHNADRQLLSIEYNKVKPF